MKFSKKSLVALIATLLAVLGSLKVVVDGLPDFGAAPAPVSVPAADAGVPQ